MKLDHDASGEGVSPAFVGSLADALGGDGAPRYLPKLIAEIFSGPYYATISPDGTVAVTVRMGKRGGWLELRRR